MMEYRVFYPDEILATQNQYLSGCTRQKVHDLQGSQEMADQKGNFPSYSKSLLICIHLYPGQHEDDVRQSNPLTNRSKALLIPLVCDCVCLWHIHHPNEH